MIKTASESLHVTPGDGKFGPIPPIQLNNSSNS
jgi:hypothetical protein